MKNNYSYSAWTKRLTLSVAGFCVAATAAHAQYTSYATNFDGTDTNNNLSAPAPYLSPATPTDPLSGQNGWGTNDNFQNTTNTTQYVGKSDFVGATNAFTGQNGVLGGFYRTATPTAAAPDVVPSTASAGLVTLYHAATIPGSAPFISLNVDFVVTAPGSFGNKDTFGFSLANAAGNSLVAFTFSPSTSSAATTDRINLTTVSGGMVAPGDLVTLGGSYHLALTINTVTGSLIASINNANFSGNVAGSLGITQVVTTWNVADRTVTNGGYTNAGDTALVFDNLAVTVPEPSTYAMMALGLVGLAGMLRLRRKQA